VNALLPYRRLAPVLLVATLPLLCWKLYQVAVHCAGALATTEEVTFPEGAAVHAIVRFAAGQPLYGDYRTPPFLLTQYAPVYYVLCGWIARVGSLTPAQVFVLARAVSFASFLAVAVLVGVLTYRWRRAPAVALLAGLAFAYAGYGVGLDTICGARTDTLACLFTLAGVFLFVEADRARGSCWAAGPLLLAVYTKQSFVAAPASVVVLLVAGGRWRHALRFAALFAALGGAVFALGEWGTGGLFSLNTVTGNQVPWYPALRLVLLKHARLYLVPLVLLAATAVPRSVVARWALTHAVLSTLWAFATTAKAGASSNYYLEPVMALALLVGAQLPARTDPPRAGGRWRAVVLPAALLWAFTSFWSGALRHRIPPPPRPGPTAVDVLLAGHPPRGPVVSNAATPVVRNALDALMIDPWSFALLESTGRWDGTELLRLVRERRLAQIIRCRTVELPWPRGFIEAVERHYRVAAVTPDRCEILTASGTLP
jgi:hypothetical protein